MEGEERRAEIVQILKKETKPVSGGELARRLEVSRQVIVQDIALLRASNRNILSTNKGYLYDNQNDKKVFRRAFFVCHDDSEMEDELDIIVDNGGRLKNVVIDHEIYGQITVDLILENRCDVFEFMEKINNKTARPLSILTNGRHYHMVEADKEDILDRIERQLKARNYLISTM